MSFANGTPDGYEHTLDLVDRTGIPRSRWDGWRRQRIGPPFVKRGHLVLYRTVDVDHWLDVRRGCTGWRTDEGLMHDARPCPVHDS